MNTAAISRTIPITAMERLKGDLLRLRQSPTTPTLLVGPSGAGKQHTAELLHSFTHSDAQAAPFVTVDCAALPHELADSELFGHERGAFPDATAERRGLVELAHGGSLLLHEVGALPLPAQSMLLRFLDGMRLRRLGAQRELVLSMRLIATSSCEPLQLVKQGLFHENLYRRLSGFRFNVPPLAQRQDELLGLAQVFLEQLSCRMQKPVTGLSPEAEKRLLGYAFPGNVRELRSVLERALINAKGPLLSADDLQLGEAESSAPQAARFFQIDAAPNGVPLPLDAVEQAYVRRVLEHTGGKRMAAAQLLGISYPTFLKRLRELQLDEAESGVHAATR